MNPIAIIARRRRRPTPTPQRQPVPQPTATVPRDPAPPKPPPEPLPLPPNEGAVLALLAQLTDQYGPWEAARRLFGGHP